ncbi:MAG: hypothetical protein PHH09_04010 [Methanoregulaceae archaeon]|nr:hypothetical protein [Methanoregulaceae archaeon]
MGEFFEGDPFGFGWKNTRSEKTHKREFQIACLLNDQLSTKGMRAHRVPGNKYSLYDLEVILYDWGDLRSGPIICRIDVEEKPDRFKKNQVPDRYVRGVSFLVRKTKKEINYDRDVYVLVDCHPQYPRIMWAHYKIIRDFGEYEDRGPDNRFLVIRKRDYDKINFGFHSLVKWCTDLKNQEVPP